MKKFGRLIVLFFTQMSVTPIYAEDNCVGTVDMGKLREAVGRYSDFYGDLPSRINCAKPIGNQKIICENDVLRFMEKLDHIGGVYAYENATKIELDHRKPNGVSGLNKMLKRCRTAECICSNFKQWADSTFGGESPYAAE